MGKVFCNFLSLFHANLKTSNILVTSDNVVFISDFAPYKPVFFDESNFDRISLFYPNILDSCFFAPERIDQEKAKQYAGFNWADIDNSETKIFQKLDYFSVGCILYEIFSGGKPLLNYKELL